jgi:hypothetical protein
MVRIKNKTPGVLHITWLNLSLGRDEQAELEDSKVEGYIAMLETLAERGYIEFERVSEKAVETDTGSAETAEQASAQPVEEPPAEEQPAEEQSAEQQPKRKKK